MVLHSLVVKSLQESTSFEDTEEDPTPREDLSPSTIESNRGILHEKHLGTAFVLAITQVETFLHWLLETKKKKGGGKELAKV